MLVELLRSSRFHLMAALGAAPHAQLRLLNKLNFLNYFYVIEKNVLILYWRLLIYLFF